MGCVGSSEVVSIWTRSSRFNQSDSRERAWFCPSEMIRLRMPVSLDLGVGTVSMTSAHTTGISCSPVDSYRGVVVVVVVVVDVELGGALSGAPGCPLVRSMVGLLLVPPDS